MKKFFILLAVAITAIAYAAQDSSLSIRQVRDPVQLKAKLNANAADAEARIADLEVTIGTNVNGAVSVASLTASGAVTGGSFSTTGAVGIAEGQLTDSTVVSADIKNGEIVNADVNAAAAITGGKLDLTSGTGAITSSGLVTGAHFTTTGNVTIATSVSAVLKATSGVVGAAAAGTDFLAPNAVNTTNALLGVDGTTNTIIVLKGLITSWTVTP